MESGMDLGNLEELERRYRTALAAADGEGAVGRVQALNERVESLHADTLHRIALLHCRRGETEAAYWWLRRALDAGYWDVQGLLTGEEFRSMQGEERFKRLVRDSWCRQYLAMLERPDRADLQDPKRIMEALALRPGDRVADIGAGSGYFTVRIARAVGANGVVWAVDIRQPMLDFIAGRLDLEGLDNVRLGLATPEDPMLPEGSFDRILLVDTLHYVTDRTAYARRVRSALAEGGRVAIIDFVPRPDVERVFAPPPSQQIPLESIDSEMSAAGFVRVETHTFLPEHYFVEYCVRH